MLKNNPNNYSFIKIFAGLFILIVFAVFVIFFAQRFNTKHEPLTNSSTESGASLKPNYDILAIDFIRAVIQDKIDNSKLIVKIKAQEQNPFLKGKIFEVTIDEATSLFLLNDLYYLVQTKEQTFIKPLKDPRDKQNVLQTKPLETADLNANDELLIFSRQDIRDSSAFTAKEIYKLQ